MASAEVAFRLALELRPVADVDACRSLMTERPTSPIRITAVIASLGAGGAQRNLLLLCDALAARGYAVALLTTDPDVADFFPVPVGVRRLHAHPDAHLTCRWFDLRGQVRRFKAMRESLLSERPNLVLSFIDTTNIAVLAALVGSRVPVIVSERIDPRFHPLSVRWRLLRWLLYPSADRVVLVAESSLDWAHRFRPRWRLLALPNPVYPHVAARDVPRLSERKRVIAAGRLHRQKGFDLLIEAFSTLAHQFEDWELVIYGDGAERSGLERQLKLLQLEARVQLPGSVSDLPVAFGQGDLFVLSSRYEGFPMALAEAMAAGLPVISFDCPSGPAVMIRNGVDGLLVPPEDVHALARAMRQLMSDPQARKRLAARAVGVSERFAPDQIFGQWDALIRAVLAEAA